MPGMGGGAPPGVDTIYGQPLLMRIHQGAISACARERVLNRQWYKPNVNYTREDFARVDNKGPRETPSRPINPGVFLGPANPFPPPDLTGHSKPPGVQRHAGAWSLGRRRRA